MSHVATPLANRHLLEEVVRRIVEVAQPDRILLFGSTARGDRRPDSDIDLLVVKSGVKSRRRLAQKIYLNLFGIPLSVDVVVIRPEDADRLAGRIGSVVGPALSEGRVIYVAA